MVRFIMFILKIYGKRLVRLVVQLRLPTTSYRRPMSFESLPLLLAGPAAMVKFNKGLSTPAFTEAWSTIWGSWLGTFPPASTLLLLSQGVLTPALKVILLLKVLKLFWFAASRRTKILLVIVKKRQLLIKQFRLPLLGPNH